jgi:hypothetical protein
MLSASPLHVLCPSSPTVQVTVAATAATASLAALTTNVYDSILAPQSLYVLYLLEAVLCLYASTDSGTQASLGTSFGFDANRAGRDESGRPTAG